MIFPFSAFWSRYSLVFLGLPCTPQVFPDWVADFRFAFSLTLLAGALWFLEICFFLLLSTKVLFMVFSKVFYSMYAHVCKPAHVRACVHSYQCAVYMWAHVRTHTPQHMWELKDWFSLPTMCVIWMEPNCWCLLMEWSGFSVGDSFSLLSFPLLYQNTQEKSSNMKEKFLYLKISGVSGHDQLAWLPWAVAWHQGENV